MTSGTIRKVITFIESDRFEHLMKDDREYHVHFLTMIPELIQMMHIKLELNNKPSQYAKPDPKL